MSEHTDAARLEATRDAIRTGTAPRPRVEGEAIAPEELDERARTILAPVFEGTRRDLRRAAATIRTLTAEVERLRGVAMDAASRFKGIAHQITRPNPFSLKYDSPHQVSGDIEEQVDRLLAALSLPTHAPEAKE